MYSPSESSSSSAEQVTREQFLNAWVVTSAAMMLNSFLNFSFPFFRHSNSFNPSLPSCRSEVKYIILFHLLSFMSSFDRICQGTIRNSKVPHRLSDVISVIKLSVRIFRHNSQKATNHHNPPVQRGERLNDRIIVPRVEKKKKDAGI